MQIKIVPLIIIFFGSFSFLSFGSYTPKIQKKLLLIPAGDAHTIGRYIGDGAERSSTLQCAQKMKHYLEKKDSTVAVLISRKAGEVTPFLQNAHSANCIPVNLVISLNFFQETDARPNFFIYRYTNSASFIKPTEQLMMYPYHQAYLFNQDKTDRVIKNFMHYLSNYSESPLFTFHKPLAFPAHSLVGIIPVAFMIEVGIKDEHGYESYIQPLCDTLIAVLRDLA